MPTYEYYCSLCGLKKEIQQKITEAPLKTCLECGQDSFKRGPGGGIGLAFIGSGWYKDNYSSVNSSEKEKALPTQKDCCSCGNDSKNSCSN